MILQCRRTPFSQGHLWSISIFLNPYQYRVSMFPFSSSHDNLKFTISSISLPMQLVREIGKEASLPGLAKGKIIVSFQVDGTVSFLKILLTLFNKNLWDLSISKICKVWNIVLSWGSFTAELQCRFHSLHQNGKLYLSSAEVVLKSSSGCSYSAWRAENLAVVSQPMVYEWEEGHIISVDCSSPEIRPEMLHLLVFLHCQSMVPSGRTALAINILERASPE